MTTEKARNSLPEAQRLAPDPPSAFWESRSRANTPLGQLSRGQELHPAWDCVPGMDLKAQVQGLPFLLGWGHRSLLGLGDPRGTYITGQLLVVFHELFILLVDGQHLADTVGCCLRLATREGVTVSHLQQEHLVQTYTDKASFYPCSSQDFEFTPSSLLFDSPGAVPWIRDARGNVFVGEVRRPLEKGLSLRPNIHVGKTLIQ